jgi:hypothetical protein
MEVKESPSDDWVERLEQEGCAVLRSVFTGQAVDAMIDSLASAFAARKGSTALIRDDQGQVYAARNVLELWPGVDDAWRKSELPCLLGGVLGTTFGLVRVLYFDKPPQQSWALPWHKDLTVAVRDNGIRSSEFSHPTCKAGVPHAEAPLKVLQGMPTARIHLDPAGEENGALKVIPGSHYCGKALALESAPPRLVTAAKGDVLVMRPLLAHCSGKSQAGTNLRRRVLHLEFAASEELPNGYIWHTFLAGRNSGEHPPIPPRQQFGGASPRFPPGSNSGEHPPDSPQAHLGKSPTSSRIC